MGTLRKIAECLYGEVGRLAVDLHASLDAIYHWKMKAKDYIEWADKMGIHDKIIKFVVKEVLKLENRSNH